VDDSQHGISWLDNPAALFGYLHSRANVLWRDGSHFISKSELFEELRRTSRSYAAIEVLPHEPKVQKCYYANVVDDIKPGEGRHLECLLDFFCPAEPIDRDLILAAFLTVAWGGPGGSRPCFVVTADGGRGCGKSTLVEMLAHTFNGLVDFSRGEDIALIKQRLLSPEALIKRIAFLDNVKTFKLSWAELEGIITATTVSGKRMYIGEASRPNTITWFVTLNGASLSKDLAQRSIIIKLAKPRHCGDWRDNALSFIEQHRNQLIGDVIGILRRERQKLIKHSRWGLWERDILGLLPDPAEAQLVIADRQGETDSDTDEATALDEGIAQKLAELHYNVDCDRVFMASSVVRDWHEEITADRKTTQQVSKLLSQMISEGSISRIRQNTCRTWGRGFVWYGTDWSTEEPFRLDLEERLRVQKTQNRRYFSDA
jgi:hypothetical protein